MRGPGRGRTPVAATAGARLPDDRPHELPALPARRAVETEAPVVRTITTSRLTPATIGALALLAAAFSASVMFTFARGGLDLPVAGAVPTPSAVAVVPSARRPSRSPQAPERDTVRLALDDPDADARAVAQPDLDPEPAAECDRRPVAHARPRRRIATPC